MKIFLINKKNKNILIKNYSFKNNERSTPPWGQLSLGFGGGIARVVSHANFYPNTGKPRKNRQKQGFFMVFSKYFGACIIVYNMLIYL